jgi:antitoxin CcdA
MRRRRSTSTRRRVTSVRIRSDLLAEARKAGVDLSATVEQAPIEELAAAKRRKWREDNRDAIDAYNRHVMKHGMLLAASRRF